LTLKSLHDVDIKKILNVGIELSSESNHSKILETILELAKSITHADGGSIYTVSKEKTLQFELMQNNYLNIKAGGTSGKEVRNQDLPLFNVDGTPVLNHVATSSYHQNKIISNMREIGSLEKSSSDVYQSVSFLTVPMRNYDAEIIGILQLINARNPENQQIIGFTQEHEFIVESLASQAAVAITTRSLIDRLEKLFESFITMINKAIDDKSPYTGAHCYRIPELTLMIANEVQNVNYGPFKDFDMSEKDRYELKIASLLHDCGKITTPVHVVDKATKLETIFDRIHLIDTRFEVVKRDLEIKFLKSVITKEQYDTALFDVENDRDFIRRINFGTELMHEADNAKLHKIASKYSWVDVNNIETNFLTPNEIYNLSIQSGTLNQEERKIINRHIEVTLDMLSSIDWPAHLKNVPEFAGGHHEKMDGTGYPKGLKKEEMSIQARCMGIADIFEALTAKDRPYKKGKTLSESLRILGKFKLNNHIDPDIFNIFIWEKIYESYAKKFLDPDQIDDVDVTQIPGYEPPPSGL